METTSSPNRHDNQWSQCLYKGLDKSTKDTTHSCVISFPESRILPLILGALIECWVIWHPEMHEGPLYLTKEDQVSKSTIYENGSLPRPTLSHAEFVGPGGRHVRRMAGAEWV